jgi:hypothetical protein
MRDFLYNEPLFTGPLYQAAPTLFALLFGSRFSGICPLPWSRLHFNFPQESFGQGQKKVMDFHKAWGKYDWTQTLD